MKWIRKQPAKPSPGDRRTVQPFALLPKRMSDGVTVVWLERYIAVQELQWKPLRTERSIIYEGYLDWVVLRRFAAGTIVVDIPRSTAPESLAEIREILKTGGAL